jgi:aminoglycoside/choline kinase family phosphotransferase
MQGNNHVGAYYNDQRYDCGSKQIGNSMTAHDARIELIREWLTKELKLSIVRFEPASADASFRRYFRLWEQHGATHVVMDAPPDKEDVGPFLKVAAVLERCGVHVPRIVAADGARGLLLLEDLGSVPYLTQLRAGADPDVLYADALEALRKIQVTASDAAGTLPPYDRTALEREMELMPLWFCERHLSLTLDDSDRELLRGSFDFLTSEALAQPVVFVHRDYHSRNLMLVPERNPGVIDFQDALAGPVGYDLVSLLKDCYIEWPRARVEQWLSRYRAQLRAVPALAGSSEQEFLRWFDLIGVQRHLKVLGIFARLWYRDGKSGYLPDLPRTLGYVRDTARRYPELHEFADWIDRRIVPVFKSANANAMASSAR